MAETIIPNALQLGAVGILISILIGACVGLWKAKEKRDEYIRDADKKTLGVLKDLTALLDTITKDIGDMPQALKDKLGPKIEAVAKDVQEIKAKINNEPPRADR